MPDEVNVRLLLYQLPHILLLLSLIVSVQLAATLIRLPREPALAAAEESALPRLFVSRDLLAEQDQRSCVRGSRPEMLSEAVDLMQPMDFFQGVQATPLALAQQGHIVQVRSDLFVVSRETLALSTTQEVVARPADGGGVRLARVRPQATLHLLGLRTGDVLHTLNGTPLDGLPLGVLQERMLLLDFVREGEAQQLRYLLVDAAP